MESYSTEKSIPKRKIGECSYHLCDKKQVELFKCDHCKDYFCKEHFDARIPMLAPFKSTDIDIQLEWEKKGGHPCIPYVYYAVKKEEELKIEREHIYYGKKLHVDVIEPKPEIKTKLPEIPDSIVKETHNNTNFEIPQKQITATEKDSHEEITKKIDLLFEGETKKESNLPKFNIEVIESETEEKQIEESIIKPIEKKQKVSNRPVVSRKIVSIFLVVILLLVIWSTFNVSSERYSNSLYSNDINNNLNGLGNKLNDASNELTISENMLEDKKNELSSIKNQQSSTESKLEKIDNDLNFLRTGGRYKLHDPTYSEVLNFIRKDKTDRNEYTADYTCAYFSMDVSNNAEKQGIRCAYVEVNYADISHAIVAFNTIDKGLIYFEPQHDVQVHLEIGKRYYKCLDPLPGYYWPEPDYDDTIQKIIIFW